MSCCGDGRRSRRLASTSAARFAARATISRTAQSISRAVPASVKRIFGRGPSSAAIDATWIGVKVP
jgi:hypothetical protein